MSKQSINVPVNSTFMVDKQQIQLKQKDTKLTDLTV